MTSKNQEHHTKENGLSTLKKRYLKSPLNKYNSSPELRRKYQRRTCLKRASKLNI